jgi:membrane protein implicated in regulation of membrane protease activity
MMEALKKLVMLAVSVAVLLLLLYIAFYLFLVGLVFIAGVMIYVKWKAIKEQNNAGSAHHYWWQHPEHGTKTTKTVILETTEYEEITIEDNKK